MRPLNYRAAQAVLLATGVLLMGGCASNHTEAEAKTPPLKTKAEIAKASSFHPSLFGLAVSVITYPSRLLPHKKPGPPKAQAAEVIGTIKMVNKENGFVLIDAYVYQNTSPGDTLLCISGEKQTATLQVSQLRSSPFLIGDIKDGTPAVGDQVYKPGKPGS